jgi:hypothetical protein
LITFKDNENIIMNELDKGMCKMIRGGVHLKHLKMSSTKLIIISRVTRWS